MKCNENYLNFIRIVFISCGPLFRLIDKSLDSGKFYWPIRSRELLMANVTLDRRVIGWFLFDIQGFQGDVVWSWESFDVGGIEL